MNATASCERDLRELLESSIRKFDPGKEWTLICHFLLLYRIVGEVGMQQYQGSEVLNLKKRPVLSFFRTEED